jgi:peptidoglycan hydrolase-like protein with peptidoglycan-binding domain
MSRLLRQGDQGADVRALQDVLNFHIRRLPPLPVIGRFGPSTHARVIDFQRSNGLSPDGVVGPRTAARLFETEHLPLSLRIIPTQAGASGAAPGAAVRGLPPPRLIPPLILPGRQPSAPVLPVLSPVQLFPSGTARLPALTPQGQTLVWNVTVPVRNDPQDPTARSQGQVLQLLQTLPQSFPFRAQIIGAVPQPVRSPGPAGPSAGFQWGVAPLFELNKLGPPVEFAGGVKGQARYTLHVVSAAAQTLKLGLFVGGDFKALFDYTSSQASARPLLMLQGSVSVGLGGVF